MNKRLFTILIIVLFLLANMATLAVSNPVQVWVDDDYTDTNSGEHTWGVDAFATIQEGINTVEAGGTVNVAAGTYEEAFTIDKTLTLKGPKSGLDAKFRTADATEAVIDPNDSSAGAEKSWVIKPRASSIIIDGFVIQNPTLVYGSAGLIDITGAWDNIQIINNILQQPGVSTSASTNWGKFGINVEGASNILIENNYFKDILCDTATPWNGTSAIWPSGSSNIEILNNKIENATSFGVGLSSNNTGVTIIGNEITLGVQSGTAEPSTRTAGIRIGAGNDNITIEDNLIYNCTGTTTAPAAGITIQNEGTNNITNNQIMDNIYGVNIVETAIVSTTTINNNEIKGNTEYGILNNTTGHVDAIKNWWGDESGPYHDDTNLIGLGNSVSDNVIYDPWYSDEGMTQLVSNNPVYNSTQDTFYNTIQDAINNADDGDIIELSTGTYNYQSEGEPSPAGLLKITKPLTIKAASGALPVIDGSGFDGVFKIHPSALTPGGQVVIEGLNITGDSVTDIAITMQGCFDGIPAQVIIRDNQIHGMNGGIDFWGAGAYLPSGWTSAVAGIEITGNQFYDLGQDSNGFGVMLEDLANWTTAGNSYAAVVDGNNFNNINDSGTDPAIGIIIPRANDAHEAVNTHIANNDFSNISVDIAITDGDVSDTTIVDNNFGSGGTGIFVENISNGPVDATQNWWGDEIGPYNVNTNPEGLGDEVSDNVLYYHWYADNSFTTLYSANAITLTKTGPATAKKGDEITYQLNYKNEGNFVETNVVITETYPSEVDFVSSNPDPDSGTNNKWTFGKLEAGDEGTIEVTVKIK